MYNMNQANVFLNNKYRLHTLDLAVDPTVGWLESMKAAVAVETAAEVAVGRAVLTAAVAAAVALPVVERKRYLGLVRHRRWPWESFPWAFSL